MTRIRVLLLMAVLAANAAAERKPFAMGLLGGVSGSTFWGKSSAEGDFTIYPTGGVSAGVNLPALLGLELDLLYINKNGTTKGNETDPQDSTVKIRSNIFTAHSLSIPLLLKITAPTGDEVMPIFFGGPALSIYMGGKTSSEYVGTDALGNFTPEPIDPPIIAKKDMAKYDISLVIGGGLEWGLGTIQLRFDVGQNSLDKTDKIDIKTLSAMVIAGFIF